jgi:hypothetical protein
MKPEESNRLRDQIIHLLEVNGVTEMKPLYPLLHFFEGELHEYGKTLQGTIIDLEFDLNNRANKHAREVTLLESKIDELNEGLTEVRNDYQDICELAGQLAPRAERAYLLGEVSRENWDRFKNHIGW